MIQQNIDILLDEGEMHIDDTIRVYKGDSGILLSVKVEKQVYTDNKYEVIDMLDSAVYGRAILRHRDNEEDPVYCTEVMDIIDSRLPILIPSEAIDETREMGIYEMQIQIYSTLDEDLNRGRLTLPPFEIEVCDLISEDMVLQEPIFPDSSFVSFALADQAVILKEEEEELPIVDEDENYIETEWTKGDTIWANQLNKIENAISWLFNKIKSFVTKDELDNYATNEELGETNDSIANLRQSVVTLNNELGNKVNTNTTNIDNMNTLIEDIEAQLDDINDAGYIVGSDLEKYITENELDDRNYVNEGYVNDKIGDIGHFNSVGERIGDLNFNPNTTVTDFFKDSYSGLKDEINKTKRPYVNDVYDNRIELSCSDNENYVMVMREDRTIVIPKYYAIENNERMMEHHVYIFIEDDYVSELYFEGDDVLWQGGIIPELEPKTLHEFIFIYVPNIERWYGGCIKYKNPGDK